jgi:hypothetical protein
MLMMATLRNQSTPPQQDLLVCRYGGMRRRLLRPVHEAYAPQHYSIPVLSLSSASHLSLARLLIITLIDVH